MDPNYYEEQEVHTHPGEDGPQKQPSPSSFPGDRSFGMATAALILGIISLVSSCCFYLSIPMGALAILLALLSRGSLRKFSSQAKSGMILGIVGLAATSALLVSSLFLLGDGRFREQLEDYMEYYSRDAYDSDQDEILEEFFEEPDEGGSDIYDNYNEGYFNPTPYREEPADQIPGDTI